MTTYGLLRPSQCSGIIGAEYSLVESGARDANEAWPTFLRRLAQHANAAATCQKQPGCKNDEKVDMRCTQQFQVILMRASSSCMASPIIALVSNIALQQALPSSVYNKRNDVEERKGTSTTKKSSSASWIRCD
jgi:hypothetical protein